MINYFWIGLCVAGILFAMLTGRIDEVNLAVFESAKEAVVICIGLISVLVFWLGLMRVAQDSGLLDKLTKLLQPLAQKIFPDIPKDHPAMGYILSNMIANMFGLGNAATPLGIKAMEQLKQLNANRDSPSRSMITFIALNTAGLTILPTSVIAIRMNNGSEQPTEIVGAVFFATLVSTIITLMIDRYYYYKNRKKRND